MGAGAGLETSELCHLAHFNLTALVFEIKSQIWFLTVFISLSLIYLILIYSFTHPANVYISTGTALGAMA